MILALALFAVLAPTDASSEMVAGRLEDYTYCLWEKTGPGPLEREAANARALAAMTQCSFQREAAIDLAVRLLAPRLGAESSRTRIEQALASVEAIFPRMLAAG